jgi:hypothetical protein
MKKPREGEEPLSTLKDLKLADEVVAKLHKMADEWKALFEKQLNSIPNNERKYGRSAQNLREKIALLEKIFYGEV